MALRRPNTTVAKAT